MTQEKQPNPNGGSSDGIKIINEELEIKPDQFADGAEEQLGGTSDALVGEMLVEATVKMLGKTLEMLTHIPEMNFDDEEVLQLKTAWTPLVPSVSPVVGAIVITATIAIGKVAIWRSMKDKVLVSGDSKFVKAEPFKEGENIDEKQKAVKEA